MSTSRTHTPPQIDPNDNEEFMLEPVPRAARRPWWSMFAIWVGFGYVPTGLIVGGQTRRPRRHGRNDVRECTPSNHCWRRNSTRPNISAGLAAMRTGLNLSLISRISYGKMGIILPMFIMALQHLDGSHPSWAWLAQSLM